MVLQVWREHIIIKEWSQSNAFYGFKRISATEDYDLNEFQKYYHLRNENLPHQLIKNPKKVSKNGKKYHKSDDCVVCKEKNIWRQTTFVCQSCSIPLCSPVLGERTQAPRDCFRLFHEEFFCSSEFSVESLDDIDPYDSVDDFEQKPAKCQYGGNTTEKRKMRLITQKC